VKAPPLVLGMGAGLLAMAALAPLTGDAVGRLARARATRDALVASVADRRPLPPVVAPALAIPAADAATARAALLARVQRLAKGGGVLVEDTGALPLPQGLAGLRIQLSGAEKAVIALADATERERPVMRWRRWRLVPIAGGGVRLSGELVAAWR
jgi:hypothetical protein